MSLVIHKTLTLDSSAIDLRLPSQSPPSSPLSNLLLGCGSKVVAPLSRAPPSRDAKWTIRIHPSRCLGFAGHKTFPGKLARSGEASKSYPI
ncbi:hypothetical protein V490_05738 [Pseudogymnoascus sp. VKM F-3557]|nr:hypothetical protein V490_05738 [Pseudogymnoascus sp. VKM F-3557]